MVLQDEHKPSVIYTNQYFSHVVEICTTDFVNPMLSSIKFTHHMRFGVFRIRRVDANRLSSSYKVYAISCSSSSSINITNQARSPMPWKRTGHKVLYYWLGNRNLTQDGFSEESLPTCVDDKALGAWGTATIFLVTSQPALTSSRAAHGHIIR